jgi:hypothetical protein
MTSDSIDVMTVAALKLELKVRGQSATGNKLELSKRLRTFL